MDQMSTPTEINVDQTAQFVTKDLNHAAFMWCQPDSELVKLDGQRSGAGMTVYFRFNLKMTKAAMHQLQIDFANGKCRVEPGMFVDRQNKLRDLLHGSLGIQTLKREESK